MNKGYGMRHSSILLLGIIIVCSVHFYIPPSLLAAPYYGKCFNVLQPDGSRVKVKIWGDEFYQRVESLDGYTLIRDKATGWICYATLAPDGSDFVSTGIIYENNTARKKVYKLLSFLNITKHLKLSKKDILRKREDSRLKILGGALQGDDISSDFLAKNYSLSSSPPTGLIFGITLLIDFPDVPSTISPAEIENFLNQRGYFNYYCKGSVRDYFYDVSGGQVDYTNHVAAYYTANHNKGYYTDPNISYGDRARELIHEALDCVENAIGFDFSTLSTDSSNHILAINAFYAGEVDNAWSEGLWGHRGYLSPTFSADGVKSQYYQICAITYDLYLRTFCHENGHMLFDWPDLYDHDFDSTGIGNYGLMAYGGDDDNPVPPCAYLRYKAGWETVIDITDEPLGSIFTHTANSLTTYRYSHPINSKEFFLIESRKKTGRNSYLPDEGLMIWHIDEEGDKDYQEMTCSKHYIVSLEQADGLYDLENDPNNYGNYGDNADLFHSGGKNTFHKGTIPDSDWWCSGESGLSIKVLSGIGDVMSFMLSPTDMVTISSTSGGTVVNPGEGALTFTHSEPVFLEAAADIGYYFREWTGTCVDAGMVENPNKARTTVTVEGDCTLVANFELAPLTVFVPDHFATIQTAIDASSDGLTIIVREGTYIENINFLGKAITVKSTDPNNPEVVANTIIDGNQVGSVVLFENGEGPNCVLQGITISNGNSSYGGGIRCKWSSSPTISNCTISGNTATIGGGISCDQSSPTISNCTISGNTAGNGGGIYCYYNSSARITNCTITGNKAKYGGGDGGGIYCDQSSPTISNCTISGNTADGGGGIYCYSTSSPDIINSIIWENIPDEIYGGSPLISYSCIKEGYGNPVTTHNIDDDPLFLDPNAGDYRLWYASPCIDAGDPNAPKLPPTDNDDNPRIINGKPDMGAYEYIEMLTLYPGLNLASFPQGLEWSWLRDQNVPIVKIQTYQPETSRWLTLMPSDEIDFSFSSGKGWLVYINPNTPDPIELTFPYPISAFVFNPQEDLFSGMNLLNCNSLYEMLNIPYSQQLIWPKNVFQKLKQETGKDPTCISRYERNKGKWQAKCPFFGHGVGHESRIKKEDYILYLQ
jgi:M6 family metalloprotease-like protein